MHRSTETLVDGRTRTNNRLNEEVGRAAGAGRARGGGRVGGYSEVLLDYVWGKQQQLQRQQSHTSRQGATSHPPLLYNGFTSQQPPGPPPTYAGDQRKVKVTRTKSCGPFLPVQQSLADTNIPHLSTIQPDPHPHLLPPKPTQPPPTQDAHREEATRNLHKALALEGKGKRSRALDGAGDVIVHLLHYRSVVPAVGGQLSGYMSGRVASSSQGNNPSLPFTPGAHVGV